MFQWNLITLYRFCTFLHSYIISYRNKNSKNTEYKNKETTIKNYRQSYFKKGIQTTFFYIFNGNFIGFLAANICNFRRQFYFFEILKGSPLHGFFSSFGKKVFRIGLQCFLWSRINMTIYNIIF